MKRTTVPVLMVAVALSSLIAGFARAESLVEVLRAAQANDAVYASARYTYEAARERPNQGFAGLLPLINANANTTWNDVHQRSSDRDFTFNSHGFAFTFNQPIFRPQNWATYRQNQLQAEQAEMVFRQTEQDLITRTSVAYFDVLAAEDSLAFIRAQKIAISEQLAQARRNFEVGTATITDTNEAQARFDLATAQEIAAENDLEIRRRTLAQITGQRYQRLEPLLPEAAIPGAFPADVDQWVEGAIRSAYAVRAQEIGLAIAQREIDRNRYGHLPTLDLVSSHNRSVGGNAANTGVRTDAIVNTIGLQLAVPLFAGGGTDSRVREAVQLRERSRADLENARRSAEFSTRQAFLGLTNGLAQVRALEQALKSSETALASNRLGYEVGVRINIDVLNAQQQVFQTKRDLSRARYDAIVNGLRLKAAGGALNEQDIVEVNRLLGQ